MNRLLYLIASVLLFAISYVVLSFFSSIQGVADLATKVPIFGSSIHDFAYGVRIIGLLFGMFGAICFVCVLTKHFGVRVILSLVVVFVTLLVIMGLPLFDQISGYLKNIPFPSFGVSAIIQPMAQPIQNFLSAP
ncbi:Uncharacterised protein [uncultured archaeon]|nr:Uncharacterised protein [uncultured archaeon]